MTWLSLVRAPSIGWNCYKNSHSPHSTCVRGSGFFSASISAHAWTKLGKEKAKLPLTNFGFTSKKLNWGDRNVREQVWMPQLVHAGPSSDSASMCPVLEPGPETPQTATGYFSHWMKWIFGSSSPPLYQSSLPCLNLYFLTSGWIK